MERPDWEEENRSCYRKAWEEDGLAMNQGWWEEDPVLVVFQARNFTLKFSSKGVQRNAIVSRTAFRSSACYLASLALTSDVRNIGAGDAEIVQFASRKLVQFADGFTVTAPVVVRAKQVHGLHPSVCDAIAWVQFISFVAHDISYCFCKLQSRVCIAALRALQHALNRLDCSGTKLPQCDLNAWFAGCEVSYMFSTGCGVDRCLSSLTRESFCLFQSQ